MRASEGGHGGRIAVELTGRQLGPYRVLAPIGRGGMGAVFVAEDGRLGRRVALKLLPLELRRDPDRTERFLREARAASALNHPNIVTIYDVGDSDAGRFIAMELVVGRNLRAVIAERPPVAYSVGVMAQSARALAAAHAAGIIHRDIKPENIMVRDDGYVKVVDFGLARAPHVVGDDISTASGMALTLQGGITGTVNYMSPEQSIAEPLTTGTDVYSLGVVLYELLTGRLPVEAPSTLAHIAALASAVVTVPSRHAPDVPPALDELVLQMLRRDAAQRPPADDVGARLEAIATVPRVGSAPPGDRPALAPEGSRSIAVLPFTDMSPDKSLDYLCEGIAEEILTALMKVDGLRVVARSSAFRFKGVVADAREVGRTLGVQSLLEGSVRTAGHRLRVTAQLVDTANGYQLWSERLERPLDDVFAVQDEIAGAVAATLQVRLRGASGVSVVVRAPHDAEAYALYLRARHHWNKRTEADLTRAVEHFEASLERDASYAQAHAGLAEAYVTLGIYGVRPPAEVMPAAKAAAERALAIGPPLPGALATLGCVHALYAWAWDEAERCFQQALALPGADAARAWYALNYLVPRGRFGEAEAALRRALEVDPLSLPVRTGLGVCAYYARRYDDALTALSGIVELDASFALARYFRGLVFTELQRHADALAELETAVRLSSRSPETIASLGCAAARAGEVPRARRALDELTRLSTTRYVSPGLVAHVRAGLGDAADALDALEQAADLRAADLAWLGVRPVFDAVRTEARLAALQRRIGVG